MGWQRFRLLALLLFVIWLASSWGSEKTAADVPEQTFHLKIAGIFCPVCPVAISKSIRKIKGVKDVTVHYESGEATVIADASVTVEAIIAQVQEASKSMGGNYQTTVRTP